MGDSNLLRQLRDIVGSRYLLTGNRRTAAYVKGFREGYGPALAVVKPANLWQQWQALEACVKANVIVIMQAANTGLTGGSTPVPGCDRQWSSTPPESVRFEYWKNSNRSLHCLAPPCSIWKKSWRPKTDCPTQLLAHPVSVRPLLAVSVIILVELW